MGQGEELFVRKVAKVTANGFTPDSAAWMCICLARDKYLEIKASKAGPGLETIFEDGSGMDFGEFSVLSFPGAGEEFSGYEVEVGLLEKLEKSPGGEFEASELSAVALSAKKCAPFENPMAHPEDAQEKVRLAGALLAWQEKAKLGKAAGPGRRPGPGKKAGV